jgi:adenylosuccinate lyase
MCRTAFAASHKSALSRHFPFKSAMANTEQWDNPFLSRYCSPAMLALWSPQRRIGIWRRLWVALAEAQMELGLTADDGKTPRITTQQIAELKAHLDDIDFTRAAALEKQFRHDVMAHVHTYGEVCPSARGILHLGATSCYVTDNGDLLLMREGLQMLRDQLVAVIDALGQFAEKWKDLPTLGYTHFQPAQLTTVGKRATLWAYDLVLDLEEFEQRLATLRFRGAKGTTGTQASFLTLFNSDHAKVRELDRRVAAKMGFDKLHPVTGQTYTRKVDAQILDTLSGVAQSASKAGNDLRLLQHHHEIEEPFETDQIGSSAMAYKRNPMRAERMCGLARFVMNLPANAAQTAATQWLERTLDDSVNRRLSLPQAFLGTDAILRLYLNIARGLEVHPEMIVRNLHQQLPFMATEEIMMTATQAGADRQAVHEAIRRHSHAAMAEVKKGRANDLINRLQDDPLLSKVDLMTITDASRYVGRAPEQVTEFLREVVEPIRKRYPLALEQGAEVQL